MANYSDSRKSFLESQGQAYLISEAQEVRLFQKTQKHTFRYQIRKLFADPLTDCVLQLERFRETRINSETSEGFSAEAKAWRAFSLLSESQPLYLVRVMPMAHHICPPAQIVVKRLQSVQFRRRKSGEIMTDTAEGHLDEKSLMYVSDEGTSSQRSGINGLNAHPRKLLRGSGTNPAKTNPSF